MLPCFFVNQKNSLNTHRVEAGISGHNFVDLPSAGTRFALARPPGSGDAWLLGQFAVQARQAQRLVVAISADALDAQRLVDEIRYFDPSLAVRPLPDWETLPYDTLSPHQDLVSERLETLYRLSQPQSEIDVLVVSATSALYRLSPAQYVAGHTFFFKQGQTIDAEPLRAQLVFAGYQHVSQVVAPGEFAIRGGLIDLFPMGSALPYRLDLFGDQLDTIRAFDPGHSAVPVPGAEVRLLRDASFRSTKPRGRVVSPPLARAYRGRSQPLERLQRCRHRSLRRRV